MDKLGSTHKSMTTDENGELPIYYPQQQPVLLLLAWGNEVRGTVSPGPQAYSTHVCRHVLRNCYQLPQCPEVVEVPVELEGL